MTAPGSDVQIPDGTGYNQWLWEQIFAAVTGRSMPSRDSVVATKWLKRNEVHAFRDPFGIFGIKADLVAVGVSTDFWGPVYNVATANLNYAELEDPSKGWSRFILEPSRTLEALARSEYTNPGVAADPRSFFDASLAIHHVVNWLTAKGAQTRKLCEQIASTDSGFKGSAAEAVRGVVKNVADVMDELTQEMTVRGLSSYADALWDGGVELLHTLSGLLHAYYNWGLDPAVSPTSALQQVLSAAGVGQSMYFPDLRSTPFGDLTTDAGWETLEGRAKAEWKAGVQRTLDMAAQPHISKLVTQYNKTEAALRTLPKRKLNPLPASPQPGAGQDLGGTAPGETPLGADGKLGGAGGLPGGEPGDLGKPGAGLDGAGDLPGIGSALGPPVAGTVPANLGGRLPRLPAVPKAPSVASIPRFSLPGGDLKPITLGRLPSADLKDLLARHGVGGTGPGRTGSGRAGAGRFGGSGPRTGTLGVGASGRAGSAVAAGSGRAGPGPGAGTGAGGVPMYPPTAGGAGGANQGPQERERNTWLTEAEDTWGGVGDLPSAAIGRGDFED